MISVQKARGLAVELCTCAGETIFRTVAASGGPAVVVCAPDSAAAPRATHYSGDGRTRPDNKLSARWLLVIEWAMRVLSAYAARDISDPIFFRVTP